MDRHGAVDLGLFARLQGRRVTGVELDEWETGNHDWIGIRFDGGSYLSLYAGAENGEGPYLVLGFKRRCPEPFRESRDGTPLRRCRGFEDHGGRHT